MLNQYTVVFDERFHAARQFSDILKGLGARTYPIADDITDMWLDVGLSVANAGEGGLVGLTQTGALFCLEQLTREHGYRLISRGDHVSQPCGSTHHFFRSNRTASAAVDRVLTTDAVWPSLAAEMVQAVDRHGEALEFTCTTPFVSDELLSEETLVSWVLSPLRPSLHRSPSSKRKT